MTKFNAAIEALTIFLLNVSAYIEIRLFYIMRCFQLTLVCMNDILSS